MIESAPRPVRVLIVEDHPIMAEGVARVLAAEDGVEVVGTATTAAAGLRRGRADRPDVAVVAQSLPDGLGTDLALRLRQEAPDTAVVILSALAEEAVVSAAVAAGCSGFVSKNRGAGDLVRAVRAAAAGEMFLSPDAVRAIISEKAAGPSALSLTPRETDVIQCLAEGLSNQAIGERLDLTTNTVGNHLQRAMAKLGAHSKLEALVIAVRLGVVELPGPDPT